MDDHDIECIFDSSDWESIVEEAEQQTCIADADVVTLLDSFKEMNSMKKIMERLSERHPRLGGSYVHSQDYDIKWIFDSISKWHVISISPCLSLSAEGYVR